MYALSLLQSIMSPDDFAKYQGMVAPRQKQKKLREQELADRVKNSKRLQSQEASHRSQIATLELRVQRHKDMLPEVFAQIQMVSDQVSYLRALVAKDEDPISVVPAVAAIPPIQCDSQQPQENVNASGDENVLEGADVRTVSEDENSDEEMDSAGSDDVQDSTCARGNSIWESRRRGVIKNRRLVKNKVKTKVKLNKTIILEEVDESTSLPASPTGKNLADVLASLTPESVNEVVGHLALDILQMWATSIWAKQTVLCG